MAASTTPADQLTAGSPDFISNLDHSRDTLVDIFDNVLFDHDIEFDSDDSFDSDDVNRIRKKSRSSKKLSIEQKFERR
jgi:hypothetical protein